MKLGTFCSKGNIYEFDGKHYTPRWSANQTQLSINEVYSICIAGYDAPKPEPANWAKAVLVGNMVMSFPKSKRIDGLREHYDGIYEQSQLHAYHIGVAGQLPDWTIPWKQSGTLLVHEYGVGGKVAWLRPESKFENDIYIFMKDCDAPEEPGDPPNQDPEPVVGKFPTKWKISLLGGLVSGTVEAVEE